MSAPFKKLIDLTQTLDLQAPTWEGSCGFHVDIKLDYQDCTSDLPFRVQSLHCLAGIGTHIDAPCHCFPQSQDVSSLSLETLVAPFIKIDIEERAGENDSVSENDILTFEKLHGRIEKGSIALIHTGWQKHWSQKERYRNNLKFPHVSEKAAQLLLKRDVLALAIDTLSPDPGDSNFPVHRLFLGSGKYIIENITGTKSLPAKGKWLFVMPMKGKGLSEAPIRLIAALE